ncbi:hypothetical protein HWX16_16630 [Ochrobactrum intermedium]|uniref:hypothetical protein n=1 Tax=Brucella intermedia TaxID=94625 RepID=UPI00159CBB94|nr:hypothetical protein [Brucella intermedia]NVM41955.1 hypothetical protein [Brucella intermedia]
MAIRPDYNVGELTLVASSANFTTSGSALQTAAVQAGDAIITPSGHVLIIASITGQNSGTLFLPCPPDVAGTGLPLRIRFQPDGSRYQGAVRVMIDLLSSGNVEAFAALVGSNGMVPMFTGVGTMDLADPATFGIQDPNGSLGKLAALTLAANKAITTDGSGNAQQIDIDTLGRALLALAAGNNTQYVQGDGTLQSKTELPISSATQTALNSKASLSGAGFTGRVTLSSPTGEQITPEVRFNIGGQFQSSIYGENSAFNGNGPSIVFFATAGSLGGTSWGVFNHFGNLSIPGALNAASKSFIIDHPLDPYNKDLVFASTESPHHGVEFWGTVRLENGSAIVDIDAASGLSPGTFEALTQRAVALQPNNLDSDTHVRCGHVVNGKFTIYASDPNCNDEVSWLVKAERNDVLVGTLPHTDPASGRLIPEQEKPEA